MPPRREGFSISAPPDTDIWRKPPNTNRFNAPSQMEAAIPLSRFVSTRISFSGDFKYQYDQAGLLLCFFPPSQPASDRIPESWIKAGLELYNGAPKISFVGCDRFADWSLHDLMGLPDSLQNVALELRREGDPNGYALWAYQVILDQDGQVQARYPIRECTWPYGRANGELVQVGACVARPSKRDSNELLEVKFHELSIEVRDD